MKKILLTVAIGAASAIGAFAGTPASFPGGEAARDAYISSHLQYPPQAKENGIEGVVCVLFTVKTDGTIGNIKIKRMVDPDLEAESIRIVKSMPAWIPATEADQPIESITEIEIPFTLD